MTEPDLSIDQQIAQLKAGADQTMAQLQARIDGVKQAQQQAVQATGEATSKDGSVHAVVDATGVVTALRFAPSVFDKTTPDRLAQTVVATIQTAAAQARGRMSAALAPVRADDEGVTAAATAGLASLGIQRVEVPEVPRTAADPTARDAWGAEPDRQRSPEWGAIAPDSPSAEPMRAPSTSNRPRRTKDTGGADDWTTDERPW